MSVIILPSRFNKQPQYAAPIDYAGLGKGVRILFNPAAAPVDLATNSVWTPGGNASIATTHHGQAFSFDGAGDYYTATGYSGLTGHGTLFLWLPFVGPPSLFGHMYFRTATPNIISLQINSNGDVNGGAVTNSSGSLIPESWFSTTNRSAVFVLHPDAVRSRLYIDGADSGARWSSPSPGFGAGNKQFRLGNSASGSNWDTNGQILIAGWADRQWGASEARAFHENPWRLFKASPKKLWKSSGTIHYLVAETPAQANLVDIGAVEQDHALVGSALTQNGTAKAGALIQDQALAAAPAVQTSASSAGGPITQNQVLAGVSNAQANTPGIGAVTQARMLIVPGQTQGQACFAPAITQTHIIIAAAPAQENTSTGSSLHIDRGGLEAESAVQGNAAGAAIITQTHILIVSFLSQGNKAGTGAVSDGIIVEAALSTGMATMLRIKKPGIPAGTPEWLKTMIELLTGRRGNRIMPPAFRALTFSAVPTRAECEALYAYTNDVRIAVERIITRLDS